MKKQKDMAPPGFCAVPFFIIDGNGKVISLNDTAEKITGIVADELTGSGFAGLFTDPGKADEMLRLVFVNGLICDFLLTFSSRTGKTETDVMFNAFFDPEGNPKAVKIFAIGSLVTKQNKSGEKKIQKIIKEIANYKYALDESSIVAITDRKGIINYVNKNFCKISKFSFEELVGQDHRIINSGYHPKELMGNLWVTIAQGKIWRGEMTNKAKDGTHYRVDTTIVPFLNKQGNPYQYVAIGADITRWQQSKDAINLAREAKVLAGQELKVVHDRLLFHLENSPLGYIEWDERLSITSLSKRAEEIFGWNLQELKEHHLTGYSWYHIEDQPLALKTAAQLISGAIDKNKIQHRNYTKDGRMIWCEWFNAVLKNEEGKVIAIMSLVEDITERKKAEAALINNELRFREFFDTTPDALFMIDPVSGNFADYNSNALKLLKCTGEELLGKSPESISPPVQPDGITTRKKLTGFMARALKGGHPVFDWVINDSNGREIFCEIRLNLFTGNGRTLIRTNVLNITERVMLQRKLVKEKIRKQQEITDAVITAQERERSFLGEELHDNINQILAVSKFQMDIAINADTLRKDSMMESRKYLKAAMEEIRKLSKSLLPPSLGEISLLDALGELIDNSLQGNKIHFVKVWEGIDESLLNEKLSLAIFRIVQEQLNNILKYAAAKTVIVGLKQENATLRLEIKDDGVGFDTTEKRKGIGLKNIASRTAFFNGGVIIDSSPGAGCKLVVTFDTALAVETTN